MKALLRRSMLGVCILGCVLALLVCSSDSELGRWRFYLPETVDYLGQKIEVDSSLDRNELAEEAFSREADGTVTYSGGALSGVDVSSHQGEIRWDEVAQAGVTFAMLRAGYRGYSEGVLKEDAQFAANLSGAREAGLQVGVYFFSQAITPREAEEEADFVLGLLEGSAPELPIAYDWEPIVGEAARTDGLDGETITACAAAFCARVEAAGYTAAVYCNGELGYLNYDLSELRDYDLWYAEYVDAPGFAYAFCLWQYSNTGTVPGIDGAVDLDLYFPDAVKRGREDE